MVYLGLNLLPVLLFLFFLICCRITAYPYFLLINSWFKAYLYCFYNVLDSISIGCPKKF
jgi:hypothetical protein